MKSDPFTIKIYVPNGDPESVRIVELMNWTGKGIVFSRLEWSQISQREEFNQAGIYFLTGQKDEDDLPTLYIGQTDVLRERINKRKEEKDFWDRAIIFVSSNNSLNRGHITWLEYALLKQAKEVAQCLLDNYSSPKEPSLSESEKADTQSFLKQILQILPLVGLRALESPRSVTNPNTPSKLIPKSFTENDELDTVVVPAQKEGFEREFLGKSNWYAIRIAGGRLQQLKYIAAYQTQPISAITHYAPIESIEPYGEDGKYRVIFSNKAININPICFEDAISGSMQGSRYTSINRLLKAKKTF
ncbi:MAG: GIY-YIG nuclease family protein [Candidatus Melainabacteria bacterium]